MIEYQEFYLESTVDGTRDLIFNDLDLINEEKNNLTWNIHKYKLYDRRSLQTKIHKKETWRKKDENLEKWNLESIDDSSLSLFLHPLNRRRY